MPRVLLIELSATIRHIEKNLLIKAGYEVEADLDFRSALMRIRTGSEDGVAFDAVIVGWPDQAIPVADELYSMLEQQAYASLPVLAFAHEPESAMAAWAERRPNTECLLWEDYKKSTDVLAALLVEAGNRQRKLTGSIPTVQPIRVLIVDDSSTVRVKYRRLLTANGYHTETAASVDEGFEKALESPFDIAIIDYFMPDSTGDVLCQRLRDHVTTASITTAIITGTYLDKAIKQSLEAGAVECMFKNESDDLFLTRIDAMSRHIRAHQSIEKERKRLGGILKSVGEGVYGVDSDGHISFINPACRHILGYEPEERLIGKSARALFHYADADGNPIDDARCVLLQSYAGGEAIQARETVFWHKSGARIPVECTVYPLTIEEKREGSVVAFRDISERKLLEEELRWQAGHDVLTKLFNRRYFEEQLTQEADRLKRSKETSALLYIDLDRFKYINDTAGHTAGDQLLVEIAQQMTKRLRKTDLLARLGGDEFAIILRNVCKESVHQVADDYREMLDHYMFVYNDKQYKVNGTIGIALIDRDSESAGEILANADIACHIAKGEGRNRTHLFVPESDSKQVMDLDLGWSSRLHNALEHDHLVLHFQPIIPVESIPSVLMSASEGPIYDQLLSVVPQEMHINEVLLRLDDPVWGIVSPGAFLPTAERFNMMDKIDYWVINAALRKLALLQHAGYLGMFTINLSGQTIANTALIEDIEELVINLDIDSSKVIFEITETSAVSNLVSANELITRLNALGCRFALDDFGTGFSSFSHLKNLPVDFVKIDGLFVRGVATDPSDRAIVHSINDIAHSLGKETVAEYVENAEILQFLYESGVNYVQGHFLSPPMDISMIDPHTNQSSADGNQSCVSGEKINS
ncbi:MAG: EAL domain-containing protein [Candidatus Thiodiazotropha sp. (ex Myrtea sp. 'scaly one' KF741663)]|nr:EAL domain-containing protein [Candidatus Thiodiazotropha sp. (ex Myrtea sp. 'scaly one' KF741663)]